jgi:hypothetical protein
MGSFEDNQNISYLGTKNAFGNTPVVSLSQEFIGIFKGVGSTTPLIKDNSSFFLTYLVNSQGNAFKISEDSVVLKDLVPNFLDNPTCVIRLDQATQLNETLAGEQSVSYIGTPTPIAYTQTGSSRHANVDDIRFTPLGAEVNETAKYLSVTRKNERGFEFSGIAQYDSQFIKSSPAAGEFEILDVPDEEAGAWSDDGLQNSWIFTLAGGGLDLIQSITFRLAMTVYSKGGPGYLLSTGTYPLIIEIWRRRNGGSTKLGEQETQLFRPQNTSNDTFFYASFDFSHTISRPDMEEDDYYYYKFRRNGGSEGYVTFGSEGIDISISAQTPEPLVAPFQNNQNPKGYWETGSARILTSSQYLGARYGLNVQNPLTASEDFGFPPINSTFTLQQGDQIRFGYNSDNTFTIYSVTDPRSPEASGSRIYLRLNRDIPSNLNTNNFVIYRLQKDGQFVIIDRKKNEDDITEFTGAIVPQYLSEDFRNNIDDVIKQLKEDGIIEE